MVLFTKVIAQEVFGIIFNELSLSTTIRNNLVFDDMGSEANAIFRNQTFQIVNLLSRNNPHHEKNG